jgi:hypothetical protein
MIHSLSRGQRVPEEKQYGVKLELLMGQKSSKHNDGSRSKLGAKEKNVEEKRDDLVFEMLGDSVLESSYYDAGHFFIPVIM